MRVSQVLQERSKDQVFPKMYHLFTKLCCYDQDRLKDRVIYLISGETRMLDFTRRGVWTELTLVYWKIHKLGLKNVLGPLRLV